MEATYYQLHSTQRTQALRLALELALSNLTAPCSTAELVSVIARPLGVSKVEEGKLSRDVVKQAPYYAGRGRCVHGQTFQKYGRTMRRLNWLPSNTPLGDAVLAARPEPRSDAWDVPAAPKIVGPDNWATMSASERTAWVLTNTPEPEAEC